MQQEKVGTREGFGFWKAISSVGPGAIVASATIGAGETVLAVRVGAWGGYSLLWLVLLAALSKSFLTLYLLGRYAAVSGEPVTERLVHLPGPRGWFLWTVLTLEFLVAPFVFVVIAVPCGVLMGNILQGLGIMVSYKALALLFVTAAIAVGVLQPFKALERSQLVVCCVLLVGTVLATILVGPDWLKIMKGLIGFGQIPPYPTWLPEEVSSRSQLLEMAAVFGYAGSIPLNYIVYSNWVLLKGWTVPTEGSVGRALRPLQVDVGFNAILVFLVTGAFLISGAAILNPSRQIPAGFDLLTEQAHIFSQISPALIPIYYLVILVALWGTLNALPDIYGRGAHSCLSQLTKADLPLPTVMRAFALSILVLTWVFIYWEARPIIMIDLVALFSTNLGVALTCVAALWLNRQLDPAQRCSTWIEFSGVAAALLISWMSLISAKEVVGKYF